MSEGRIAMSVKNGSSDHEWLGAEAHMPNLNRELRRRGPRRAGVPSLWMIGTLFTAGLAAGCLAMRLFDRRSRAS